MRGLSDRLFDGLAIVLFVLCIVGALAFPIGCGHAAERAANTTDDVLDIITHQGDPLYEWNVEACHALETAAAELPDLDEAKAEVARIRAACDQAFDAWKVLIAAQEKAREVADLLREGNATLKQGVEAALAAERAYRKAMEAVERVRAE